MMSGLTLAAAPPDPAAVKEVLAANDALKQAMMKKDTAGVEKYLHDELIYEHSHGQNQTKADVVKATKGTTTIEAIDFSEVSVRVFGNTALDQGQLRYAEQIRRQRGSHHASERVAGLGQGAGLAGNWYRVNRPC
jgi:hypothetical protein